MALHRAVPTELSNDFAVLLRDYNVDQAPQARAFTAHRDCSNSLLECSRWNKQYSIDVCASLAHIET